MTTDEHLNQIETSLRNCGFEQAALESLTALRDLRPAEKASGGLSEARGHLIRLVRATGGQCTEDVSTKFLGYGVDGAVELIASITTERDQLERWLHKAGLIVIQDSERISSLIEDLTQEAARRRQAQERIASLEEAARTLHAAIAVYRYWFDTCTRTNASNWEERACQASINLDAALAARTKEASPSTPPPSAEPPQTGSPVSPSRSDDGERESGISLDELIRAAIDGYHHVAHCVYCGETSTSECGDGRLAEDAIAALEAALPIRAPHQEDAPATKGWPISGAPTNWGHAESCASLNILRAHEGALLIVDSPCDCDVMAALRKDWETSDYECTFEAFYQWWNEGNSPVKSTAVNPAIPDAPTKEPK